jgi:hypothetical protein
LFGIVRLGAKVRSRLQAVFKKLPAAPVHESEASAPIAHAGQGEGNEAPRVTIESDPVAPSAPTQEAAVPTTFMVRAPDTDEGCPGPFGPLGSTAVRAESSCSGDCRFAESRDASGQHPASRGEDGTGPHPGDLQQRTRPHGRV